MKIANWYSVRLGKSTPKVIKDARTWALRDHVLQRREAAATRAYLRRDTKKRCALLLRSRSSIYMTNSPNQVRTPFAVTTLQGG